MGNLTVCDKFQPTILEGQLCYTLDGALLKRYSAKSGKSNGLFLLLDPNPFHLNHKGKSARVFKEGGQTFKVYIQTLAQFTAFGPGSFGMNTLKKMTGTKSFKQLPDHQKKCLVHSREECQTKSFLDQVQRQCKCMPWALQNGQVGKNMWNTKWFSICQEFAPCGPAKETCVANQILEDEKCLVSCDGLYADIEDGSLKQNMAKGWILDFGTF